MENISFNFGAIRDSVLKLSAAEIIKEDKSVTLDKFTDLVKTNPVFHKQHLIFKNIQDSKPFQKERLAERFIAQNLQLFQHENWNNIIQENRVLRKNLLEDTHVEAKRDGELFESINTLIESVSNKTFTDFEREQKAYEHVLSYLTREVTNENEKSPEKNDAPELIGEAWKYITKIAVNTFNDRYNHLTEEEKKTFQMLIANQDDKKRHFQSLKQESLDLLNKKLISEEDKNVIELLNSFKTKIESLNEEHSDKLDEYILSCAELKVALV